MYTYQIHLELNRFDWVSGSVLENEKYYNEYEFNDLLTNECYTFKNLKKLEDIKELETILIQKYNFKIKDIIQGLVKWQGHH